MLKGIHPRLQRYGVAVLAVAITLVIKLLLNPLIKEGSPFLLFFAAIIASALYGGVGPGFLATVLAALISDYFFLIPTYSLFDNNLGQNLRLGMFVLEGLLISTTITGLNSAKRRVQLSQEALSQSKERYRAFIEQSSEGIWRFELEEPLSTECPEDEQIQHFYQYGYLAECNNVMAKMYGFAYAEEIVGARLGDFLVQSEQKNIEYLRSFIRSRYKLNTAESYEVDKQGKSKYFLNNLVGIVKNGVLVRVWGTQLDITERKQVQDALQKSEERYRSLVEATSQIIWDTKAEGEFVTEQPGWSTFTGQTYDELKGWG